MAFVTHETIAKRAERFGFDIHPVLVEDTEFRATLEALYLKSKRAQRDMPMGGIRFCYQEGKTFVERFAKIQES